MNEKHRNWAHGLKAQVEKLELKNEKIQKELEDKNSIEQKYKLLETEIIKVRTQIQLIKELKLV